MAQDIKFNYEKSIDAAVKLFWKEGYQGASLKALLKVMDIGEGSFYNTFKSKKNLYLTCLEHYNDKITSARITALNSDGTIKEKVDRFFDLIFVGFEKQNTNHGCLMTNSLSYEVLKIRPLKTYVQKQMINFEIFLFEIFEHAKSENELSSAFDSKLKAKLFITYLQGLFLMNMTDTSVEELKLQTTSFMDSFYAT